MKLDVHSTVSLNMHMSNNIDHKRFRYWITHSPWQHKWLQI